MRIVINPPPTSWPTLLTRPALDIKVITEKVSPILEAVRREGDAALRGFTEQFDGVAQQDLLVREAEFTTAIPQVSPELQAAIRTAHANIRAFHAAQSQKVREIETMTGVRCWRKSLPIEKVGLYIPGGTAPLFSTLLMLGIPAKLAGCKEIVLCTPPQKDGSIHPAILFTAQLIGIRQVYKVGGAQAIAAMGFGTESIPAVYKILGPGNAYVTAAKQLMQQEGVAIDLPAGPSEVAVFADDTSNPIFVAADLLSQAEHGADSQVLLVSTSMDMIQKIQTEVEAQLGALPRREMAAASLENSLLIQVNTETEAMALLNAYAPEHLILATDRSYALAEHVVHAGSVFLGHWTPESVGDYASGTNHTLPTNGYARMYAGVSLDTFVRKVTFQHLTPEGLQNIGTTVEVMAAAEGLEAHKLAVSHRLKALPTIPKGHRTALVQRTTNETDIRIHLNLDGTGKADLHTGLGFFDHMLEQLARHGGCDLSVLVRGDLHIDEHHTVEDTGLALGTAFLEALGDKRGIERYGFLLPMDEALAQVALDFSGRPWLVWDVLFARERVGDVPTEMWHHFFKSFCDTAKCNLNIQARGDNDHHLIESVFKAFAKAIRMAVRRDPARMDILPSTKGVL
ncbi:MAG: histidinol dehydrogenase [Rhodothermia bacterium]|nr:histidinol dehydrogenase [Rhodothermia bacterium]